MSRPDITIYRIAPADDLRDFYAAGAEGNWFRSEAEAESAVDELAAAIGGEWEVVEMTMPADEVPEQ